MTTTARHIRITTRRRYGSNAAGLVKFGAGLDSRAPSVTFCGAPVTDRDVSYRTGTAKDSSELCPECRRYAMNVKAGRKAAKARKV